MADGNLGNALITAGAALVGAIGSGLSNRRQNKKSQAHEEKMFHLGNYYNAPKQQMSRLSEAGLNPNLVYGQSSGAASGQAVNPKSPQFRATDYSGIASGGVNSVNAYYDTRLKQAQTDNVEKDTNVKEQLALLTAAKTQNTGANTTKTQEDTKIIQQYASDAAQAQLANVNAQTESTITDTQRKQALHSKNMEQAAINILKTKKGNKLTDKQIELAVKDLNLKQQEMELAKDGIYKGDPLWLRFLAQKLNSINETVESVKNFKFW